MLHMFLHVAENEWYGGRVGRPMWKVRQEREASDCMLGNLNFCLFLVVLGGLICSPWSGYGYGWYAWIWMEIGFVTVAYLLLPTNLLQMWLKPKVFCKNTYICAYPAANKLIGLIFYYNYTHICRCHCIISPASLLCFPYHNIDHTHLAECGGNWKCHSARSTYVSCVVGQNFHVELSWSTNAHGWLTWHIIIRQQSYYIRVICARTTRRSSSRSCTHRQPSKINTKVLWMAYVFLWPRRRRIGVILVLKSVYINFHMCSQQFAIIKHVFSHILIFFLFLFLLVVSNCQCVRGI